MRDIIIASMIGGAAGYIIGRTRNTSRAKLIGEALVLASLAAITAAAYLLGGTAWAIGVGAFLALVLGLNLQANAKRPVVGLEAARTNRTLYQGLDARKPREH